MNEGILVDVTGKGRFPADMLRHDCAWPADTVSAMNLGDGDRRTVTIWVSKERFFTPERWASFGWIAEARNDPA